MFYLDTLDLFASHKKIDFVLVCTMDARLSVGGFDYKKLPCTFRLTWMRKAKL